MATVQAPRDSANWQGVFACQLYIIECLRSYPEFPDDLIVDDGAIIWYMLMKT